jgi:hypothetical protein
MTMTTAKREQKTTIGFFGDVRPSVFFAMGLSFYENPFYPRALLPSVSQLALAMHGVKDGPSLNCCLSDQAMWCLCLEFCAWGRHVLL